MRNVYRTSTSFWAGALLCLLVLTAQAERVQKSDATADADAEVAQDFKADDAQWSAYGGDEGGTRYADQKQIDRHNVRKLQIAWEYRTGELGQGLQSADRLAFEATPILANGLLYLSTPTDIVIALDPATGRRRWRFDPQISRTARYPQLASRGVASWLDPNAPPATACAHRIFIGTLDGRLIALDGISGEPCSGFGSQGSVDLTADFVDQDGRHGAPGRYCVTSPPAIYRDLVIVGSAEDESRGAEAAHGTVRAFDARTGALRWSWDPIKPGAPSTSARGANAGSVFSVDAARGIVYIPTASAAPNYFGGDRQDDAYADSVVALHAADGKMIWSRQLVHHDLWNYDLAGQPVLVDFDRDGNSYAAVAQPTKTGAIFILDRDSGDPINDIVERAVPISHVPGEHSSPTQPYTTTPTLTPTTPVTPEQAWGLTFYDRGKCRTLIRALHSEGLFTPPSLQGSIEYPGDRGGIGWGSAAYDGSRQLLVTAVNHVPTVLRLVPRGATPKDLLESLPLQHSDQVGTPYTVEYGPLVSPFGLPCIAPPWGTLAAIDLQRNEIVWQVPLGSTADYTRWFVPPSTIGMPNAGGPIITASGLVFIGAATDNYLRAFDITNGQELWKGRLPAGGQATPMTYSYRHRQYVMIAAGGNGGLGTTRGDFVVAFALPDKKQ